MKGFITFLSLFISFSGLHRQYVAVSSPSCMSASMSCRLGDKTVMHWYRQLPGEPPKRILYVSGGTYMVERISIQKRCVLTIKDVIPDDAATYYCAYWDPHCDRNSKIINVFGSGTKLIVSGKLYVLFISPPANTEILQKKHGNQIMYVCIIEKFYPELIRVTWTDEEKEITDNVVKGDTWQSTKEDEYSIASWLTVPAENKDKKYYCKYEHEEKKDSLEKKAAPRLPIGKI
uniref:Ig-like domain-containing protein n=1 Tax=Malurus cyaneus samueli TaxID=2593467 RepID=A0A8C5T6Q6_9PASS